MPHFISQINLISIEDAFSHSLMSTLELLLLLSGIFSVTFLVLSKILSRQESNLEN